MLLGLIIVLAFGLRLLALSSRTLWYDEAFAVLFSEKGVSKMLYGTLTPVNGAAADVHPLLYYTTLDGWMHLFGQSPVAVRLYSVLLGVATVGMVYILARELFDRRTGLIAALITAIAPFHVQYSQEARMYALLGLLLIAATWCFVRGWRSGKLIYWAGFGLCAGLSMYTQQLAAFYLLTLALVPLLTRRRDQLIHVAFGAIIAVIIYLPWLINLPSQFGKIGEYWIPKPSLIEPLLTLWAYSFVELPLKPGLAFFVSILAFGLLLVFLIFRALPILINKRQRARNKDNYQPLALTLWLVATPMVLLWLVSQWRSVYLTRALLPSGLMFYIALAWLFSRARLPRLVLAILGGAWLIAVIIGLDLQYTWQTFPRPPFDTADQYIAAQWQDGDQVVHANKITMLPMVYYDRVLGTKLPTQRYIRDQAGSGEDTLAVPTQQVLGLLADDCTATAAQGHSRVWLTIFRQQIEQSGGVAPTQQWLDQHYHRVNDQAFNDLLVYLYDQPDDAARLAHCENQP